MTDISVLLTFDDGPAEGFTEMVLDTLRDKDHIKAAFFVQTSCRNRLPSKKGGEIAALAHREEHVLAIHTGSKYDHCCHIQRAQADPDPPGGTNGLESDMIRAIAALKAITGSPPRFVRATWGATNKACMDVYDKYHLKHVYWDVDSKDAIGIKLPGKGHHSRWRRPDEVRDAIKVGTEAIKKKLDEGMDGLIYLFHDIQHYTHRPKHLISYIERIKTSVENLGYTPKFIQSRAAVEALLIQKTGRGFGSCPEEYRNSCPDKEKKKKKKKT